MGASSACAAPPHPVRVSASFFPGSLPGLASLGLSPTLGSCPGYFNLFLSILVLKVALWVSGTPIASPAGEVTTELSRNDPGSGPGSWQWALTPLFLICRPHPQA